MAYNDLPLSERAQIIHMGVQAGLKSLDDIRSFYNSSIEPTDTEFATGGKIHIAPSKKGTFTAAATKHGKSVQAFASQVLAHKENYSPAMVKKANFARNFGGHHHEDGGYNWRTPVGTNRTYLQTVKENAQDTWSKIRDNAFVNMVFPIKEVSEGHTEAVLPLVTPAVRYAAGGTKKTPSKAQIVKAAWENENPFNRGLQKNGMYSQYEDPNGDGMDAGPGLLVGATIPNKKLYTKQELDDAAYAFGVEGLASIGDAYNEKYGTKIFPTPFDTVSVAPKLLLLDARYQNGRLPIGNWPALYQAVADGNWAEALKQTRSTYTKDGIKHYDNDRVRRRADSIFPGMFDAVFFPDSPVYPTVKTKK